MLRAHPLTDPYALPVPPLLIALMAGLVVFVAALTWPGRRGRSRPVDEAGDDLTGLMMVGRAVGVASLLLAITAGRLGVDDELENLAPALVVGVAWPALFLASAVAGPVWRYVDPWDTLARLLGGGPTSAEEPPRAVWPAVAMVLPWLWYIAAWRDPLQPGSVGLVLALYTLLTVAGCLALGRRRWLKTAEPLGLLLGWVSLLPRRRLRTWQPPPGAEVLLGVVTGGLVFAALRHTELWGPLNTTGSADAWSAAGLVATCAFGAGVLAAMRRALPRRADTAVVARAVVPAVAAFVVAVAMERNRLTTSLQLLPGLLGDPFGRGWDLFGPTTSGLDPAPFGIAGLMLIQVGVLVLGTIVGVAVAVGGTRAAGRLPVAVAAGLLVDAAVLAVTAH